MEITWDLVYQEVSICFYLNPDTYLINNLLSDLYSFAKDNTKLGVIGPLMVFPNGSLQVSAARFPNLKQEIGNLTGLLGRIITAIAAFKNRFYKKKYYEVDFVFGSCMFINSELFKEIKWI